MKLGAHGVKCMACLLFNETIVLGSVLVSQRLYSVDGLKAPVDQLFLTVYNPFNRSMQVVVQLAMLGAWVSQTTSQSDVFDGIAQSIRDDLVG